MEKSGFVSSDKKGKVATIEFSHPKSNSLPKKLLVDLADEITRRGHESDVNALLITSGGDGAFCAGASFDELVSLKNQEEAKDFFMGFGRVMLALITSPVPTVVRVHGKVVGGGLGIVAACDYSLATVGASVRLSELSIGIGPFVIGPVVAHRVGMSRFSSLALSGDWKGAEWCESAGLYSELVSGGIAELDQRVSTFLNSLEKSSKEALCLLKKTFWDGCEFTEAKFQECAAISGNLSLAEFCRSILTKRS